MEGVGRGLGVGRGDTRGGRDAFWAALVVHRLDKVVLPRARAVGFRHAEEDVVLEAAPLEEGGGGGGGGTGEDVGGGGGGLGGYRWAHLACREGVNLTRVRVVVGVVPENLVPFA